MSDALNKITILTRRVNSDSSEHDALRVEISLKASGSLNKGKVETALATALSVSTAEVRYVLATHSDSDRIIDEIIDELESSSGN